MSQIATELGTRQKLVRVVKVIDGKLRDMPDLLGELYRARGGVEEYIAVHEFLAIDFAVDKHRRLVLVRSCCALSGHGM